jgi:hypothetical protein
MIFAATASPDDGIIVPAAPNYFQIRFHFSGKPTSIPALRDSCFFMPILAWKITAQTRIPVTLDDTPLSDDETRYILLPTGTILEPGIGVWKDFETWATAIFKVWRERVQQQAPKPPQILATVRTS